MNCIRSEVIFITCLFIGGFVYGMEQQDDQPVEPTPASMRDGHTQLHRAVYKGDVEELRALLEAGADVNAIGKNGDTPLHIAAWRDRPEIVSMLLAKGAAVNAANEYGITPLYRAVWHGHEGVTRALLAAKADMDIAARNGRTSLDIAHWLDKTNMVKILQCSSIKNKCTVQSIFEVTLNR